jgi:hypothetical protein
MVFIDCFYYSFNISYEELKKYNIKEFNLQSYINYTTFEKQKQLMEHDDEVKEILKNSEKEEESKPLTKKQSYCSIQDKLIYLRL